MMTKTYTNHLMSDKKDEKGLLVWSTKELSLPCIYFQYFWALSLAPYGQLFQGGIESLSHM